MAPVTFSESADLDPSVPPSGPGCVECTETDGWWVHLRRCAACGHIGCCDTSPSQHASAHARDTGHPIIRSYEPGEVWFYSFATEETGRGPELAPPLAHPEDQTAPGPAERVPENWRDLIHT
ncbi:ubiquitin-hydrolase Zn-finger-containing protein [Knoellia remsis]|uniref:Ubiquitin-hydrolase Zn-finger-containing protein n=1 Tax=Knoellia remsis TaxID=407159 RepID=A0A2T0UGH3_9MICO|nr:UBP-type zinc finger domain-containing protein [Knoellia remsis]PRY57053.1 ubiquitin-hydrolase Zn-finger-containing protein [Knoellia remsis]